MRNNPIFKKVFGTEWDKLPPAFKKRYANRPFCDDELVVNGTLDVHMSRWIKILSPFLRLCGALLPYEGKDIPVTVRFNSDKHLDKIGFNRTFNFADKGAYQFQSRLDPIGGDRVVEFMRFGLGWLMRHHFDGEKVRMDHRGYIWRIGKLSIPLPMHLILGRAYATEQATSDNSFNLYFEIMHPLFGKVFGYDGQITITKVPE